MLKIDLPTLRFIIEEVSRFDSTIIIQGDDSTIENQLINKFIDGTVTGYKDAVQQIVEYLERLYEEKKSTLSVEERTKNS